MSYIVTPKPDSYRADTSRDAIEAAYAAVGSSLGGLAFERHIDKLAREGGGDFMIGDNLVRIVLECDAGYACDGGS